MLYYEILPVIFLAQIQASHTDEIRRREKIFYLHTEILFHVWYYDVIHEQTTFSLFPNIIAMQHSENHEAGGNCVIGLFLELHVCFQ